MSGSASPPDLRLLYVCLERLRPGGAAATHVTEICEGLRRRGFSVRLCAEAGSDRNGPAAQAGRYLRVLSGTVNALLRSDLVYVRSHFAALPLALLARLLGRPVVHEINGSYEDALVTHPAYARLGGPLRRMQRAQYRRAAALIAVTPDLAEWARAEAGHDRVHVVANAANISLFRPDGPATARARRYAIFVGGLTRWHGVETMLAAARDPGWPSDVDLVITGPIVDPSLEAALRSAPGNVAYLGVTPQPDLPALIRGAMAALVPITDPGGRSAKGVLPLKLYEALACGAPVIVTDLRGQAELVRDGGCGLVVPVDDPPALARAVAHLAAEPDLARRLGRAGARLVAAEHSWDARAEETAAILRDAVTAWR